MAIFVPVVRPGEDMFVGTIVNVETVGDVENTGDAAVVDGIVVITGEPDMETGRKTPRAMQLLV